MVTHARARSRASRRRRALPRRHEDGRHRGRRRTCDLAQRGPRRVRHVGPRLDRATREGEGREARSSRGHRQRRHRGADRGSPGRCSGSTSKAAAAIATRSAAPKTGPASRRTCERVAKTLRAMDNGVTDHFSRMLVLSSGPVLPELWDTASGGEAAPAPANQSKFADLLKDAQEASRVRFPNRALAPEWEGALGLRRVRRRPRAGRLFLRRGHRRSGTLFQLPELSDYHLRYTQTLSAQPIEGWLGERGGWITLTKAAIALETADNKSGSIASELTLKRPRRGPTAQCRSNS